MIEMLLTGLGILSRANQEVHPYIFARIENLSETDKIWMQGDKRALINFHFRPLFDCGNGLYRGCIGTGLPANYALLQKRGQKWFIIRSVRDLRGHVKIANEEQALNFCRLATALQVSEIFLDDHADLNEIAPLSSIKTRTYFAQSTKVYEPDGYRGFVTDDWFHRNQLKEPKIIKTKSGWKVSRSCFEYDYQHSDRTKYVQTEETVTPDGHYKFKAFPIKLIYKPEILMGQGPRL